MRDRSSKKRADDLSQLAKIIVERATSDYREAASPEKNPAAVALGRLGGRKGGKARAEKLTAEERTEIAQKAARARWNKHSRENDGSK